LEKWQMGEERRVGLIEEMTSLLEMPSLYLGRII
jgi:hypothetical protein